MNRRYTNAMLRFALAAASCLTSNALAEPNNVYWSGEVNLNGVTEDQAYNNFNQYQRPQPPRGNTANPLDQLVARAMQTIHTNPSSAAALLAQAAQQGHPQAAFELGVMCFNGTGMPANPADAYLWYSVAAKSGIPRAAQYALDAANRLSPQQRAAVEQRLQQFGRMPAQNGMPNNTMPNTNSIPNAQLNNFRQATPNNVTSPNTNTFNRTGINTANSFDSNTTPAPGNTETWDAGFFKVNKPRGWQMFANGQGVQFCFLAKDPSNPNRQFFQFGTVGPVFPTEADKQAFGRMAQYSPQPVNWQALPVVAPFEPANFLQVFPQIARLPEVQQFFPQVPVMENLQIIARQPAPNMIQGGKREIIRARFSLNGQPCEGIFALTTTLIQGSLDLGVPSYGNAGVFQGIIAPAGELAQWEPTLMACLKSQKFSEQYMQMQRANSKAALEGLQERGRINRETNQYISNLRNESWDYQNKISDIGQQRFTDYIRGTERMYDPTNNQVLEFDSGFNDDFYNQNRNHFEMNNLQAIPYNMQNYNRLMEPTVNGYREIR